MKLAVCMPTRGLSFTQVEKSIEAERKFHDIQVFRSENFGIPDAHNTLANEALLTTSANYILFVEEDTVLPQNGLSMLVKAMQYPQVGIACIDYGVNGYSCTARERKLKELLWCGLGCTLIKREVFHALEFPYFRSDQSLRLNDWKWVPNHDPYGQQDIWFCMKAREKGFRIKQVVGMEAKHLRLAALGTPETNKGFHVIEQKPVITKQQLIDIPREHDYFLTITKNSDIVEGIGSLTHAA